MTSPTSTRLSSQASTVRALLHLIDQFPNLPAASFDVQPWRVGSRLEIHVHDDATSGFELWREALELDPESADLSPFADFSALTIHGHYQDTPVRLVGYLPPVTESTPADLAA